MKEKINLIFVGDVVGEPGLQILEKELPTLIKKFQSNLVVVNAENADAGKGLTDEISDRIFSLGVDIITTGNHIWDNWKSRPLLTINDKVLRPVNYPPGNPGRGFKIFESKVGIMVAVVQIQGRSFMQTIDCPFRGIENALKIISNQAQVIIVDFHAETTAEKVAMGWHLDGKVSAVIGTHTHIQTNDACILPLGTGYITDVGMTGPYDSVLGMKKDVALKRFILQTAHKFELAENDTKLSAVFVQIDSETGQAIRIEPITIPKFVTSIYEEIL